MFACINDNNDALKVLTEDAHVIVQSYATMLEKYVKATNVSTEEEFAGALVIVSKVLEKAFEEDAERFVNRFMND